MVHIVTEVSKYILALIMGLYTIRCFSYFSYSDENKKVNVIITQRVLMYLLQFLCMLVIYINTNDITMIGFYLGIVVLTSLINSLFNMLYPKISQLVLNNMCMLLSVGLIVIARLDFNKAIRQFVILTISLFATLFVPVIIRKVSNLQMFRNFYAILGIIMLSAVLIFGATTGGAKLAVGIGGFSLQPSELVKILFVFYVASSLYEDVSFRNIVITSIVSALQVIILVVSRDLGAAVILFVTYVIMVYVATKKKRYVLLGGVAGALASVVAYKLFNHARVRVLIWRDPFELYDRGGYQIAQSLFAIGTGGLFGMGLTKGLPTKIPVADEDFIFSALSEELGIIFGICIILICVSCYIMFLNIAMQLQNRFYKLVALGLGSLYIFQVFLNVGGVTKFIPLTGVTLPFISYGGSSILSTMIMFGNIQGLYILRDDEERNILSRKERQLQ